jgi:hypothetical protein
VHWGVICRAVTVSPALSTASAPPQPSEAFTFGQTRNGLTIK